MHEILPVIDNAIPPDENVAWLSYNIVIDTINNNIIDFNEIPSSSSIMLSGINDDDEYDWWWLIRFSWGDR